MAFVNEDQDRYLFAVSLFGMRIDAPPWGIRDKIIAEGSLSSLMPRQIEILDSARMNLSIRDLQL